MRTRVRPPRPAPGAGTSSPLPRVRRPQRSTGSVGRWAGAPGVITQTLAPRASQSKDRALGARSLRGSRAGRGRARPAAARALVCTLSLGKAGVRLERIFTSCRFKAWEEAGPASCGKGALCPGGCGQQAGKFVSKQDAAAPGLGRLAALENSHSG